MDRWHPSITGFPGALPCPHLRAVLAGFDEGAVHTAVSSPDLFLMVLLSGTWAEGIFFFPGGGGGPLFVWCCYEERIMPL